MKRKEKRKRKEVGENFSRRRRRRKKILAQKVMFWEFLVEFLQWIPANKHPLNVHNIWFMHTKQTKQTIVLSIWSSFVPVLLWYTSLRLVYRAKSWPWKNPIKLHVPRETSIKFKTFFKKIKNDRGYPTGCKVADASIEHTYSTSYKVCLLGTTLYLVPIPSCLV